MSDILGEPLIGEQQNVHKAVHYKILKDALNERVNGLIQTVGSGSAEKFEKFVRKISLSPIIKQHNTQAVDYDLPGGPNLQQIALLPISTFYFSLFAFLLVIFGRRVWSERRKTRIYYGNGTSELTFALGSKQVFESLTKSSIPPVEEDTEESKERAWRIENLKRLVKCVEARDSLMSNAVMSVCSLVFLELLEYSLSLLHMVGLVHLISSMILCERGIIRPSTRTQGAMLAIHWSTLAMTSLLITSRLTNMA